ncbi:MAG: isoprenylcysteine carboxylmethyltransferase family protein [Flavobacteriales bacterium]|nr:isoprenylcysteine carboxylmethyltransferase family protein [Flavobacteriales bacterium]MCB9193592.1 isoprenylcysteine carboxylmethyltransferase family protein [Flavobacteriales bacterium]
MNHGIRPWILVGAQFAALVWIAFGGPWVALPTWSIVLLIASVLWVGLSAWALGRRNLTIMPDPVPANELVRRGPYKWVRHPMYLAILLGSAAVTAGAPTIFRWAALFCLTIVVVLKIMVEELALVARHPAYGELMKGTWRLLPFLW